MGAQKQSGKNMIAGWWEGFEKSNGAGLGEGFAGVRLGIRNSRSVVVTK